MSQGYALSEFFKGYHSKLCSVKVAILNLKYKNIQVQFQPHILNDGDN